MKYVAPEMRIVVFEAEEVVLASAATTTSWSSQEINPDDMIGGGED